MFAPNKNNKNNLIMKKSIFALLAVVITFSVACSSDDDKKSKSCVDLANDLANALQVYMEEDTEESCIAYKAALQAYANSDCEGADEIDVDFSCE